MAVPKSRRAAAPERQRSTPGVGVDAALAAFVAALPAGSRLCVALSGGRDSVVLLHALARLRTSRAFALSALHVHHALSANADAWTAFCKALCATLQLPLSVVHVEVPRASGEGPEGAAPRLRHAAFAAAPADFMALAHHRDDQAETVLLKLLRGAGVAGAAGMAPWRRQTHGPQLVRPLLGVPRQLLEDYASAQKLSWIDDESNRNTHFRRNFLRHEILPALAEKFPGAGQSLARAASHFAEASSLLDDLAKIDRAAADSGAGRIALPAFKALAKARAANLLRYAWTSAGLRAPETAWIEESLRQLASADALAQIRLSTRDGELRVYRDEIYLLAPPAASSGKTIVEARAGELAWSGGRVVFSEAVGAGIRRSAMVTGELRLQPRAGGERLRLHAQRPTRSVRNLLQEAALPPWERERLPLLWCGERLLWVGAIGIDCACACPPGESGIVPVWEAD